MLIRSRCQAYLCLCAVLIPLVACSSFPAANGWMQETASAQSQFDRAQSYDLCARAEGTDETNPVLQTFRAKLVLEMEDVTPDMLKLVQAELITRSVKPALGIVKIFVENYDSKTCAAAGENFLELSFKRISPDWQFDIQGINDGGLGMPSTRPKKFDTPSVQVLLKKFRQITPPKIFTNANEKANGANLRILFATNRNVTGKRDTEDAFGKEIGNLSYGEVQVQVKLQPKMKNLETTSIVKFESVTDLKDFAVANKYTMLTHEEWLKEAKARASKFNKAGVLLFVHGYNNSFVDAAAIAGQFTYDMAFNGASVMFSWPSQNEFVSYKEDGEMARSSANAMAKVLNDLTSLQKEGPVYVVAHSMGSLVLLDGMKQFLKKSSTEQKRSIAEVVLAAPDVPQKDFNAKWGEDLSRNDIHPTLYASERDLVINTSGHVNRDNELRLGHGGEKLFQMNNLVSIDASKVTSDFFALHHAYFRDNNKVASDLYGLLRERKKVEKRPNLKRHSDVYSSWLMQ